MIQADFYSDVPPLQHEGCYDPQFTGEYRAPYPGHPPRYASEQMFSLYRDNGAELQRLIDKALSQGSALRARGNLWSLSEAPNTNGALIAPDWISVCFGRMEAFALDPRAARAQRLFLVESGMSLHDLEENLNRFDCSLPTYGSHSAQRLGGAVSTSTHGGALKFGPVPECIVGIDLICGPNKHVYLERSRDPVLSDSFAAKIGAQVIRNDELFNAALVSFGAFGIVHGYILNANPRYLLAVNRQWRAWDQDLENAMQRGDPSSLPEFSGRDFTRLHHFEVCTNPNETDPNYQTSLTLMFETDWHSGYLQPPLRSDAPIPGWATTSL